MMLAILIFALCNLVLGTLITFIISFSEGIGRLDPALQARVSTVAARSFLTCCLTFFFWPIALPYLYLTAQKWR